MSILALMVAGGVTWWWAWPRMDYVRHKNWTVEQPVPFSHQHHVAGLGIDCRFCHVTVETAGDAGLPPTYTCMTCHSQIWTNAGVARAGAGKPCQQHADHLASRDRSARLCLLQPQDPHRQGRWLRKLPWHHAGHGADAESPHHDDGLSAWIAIAIPDRTCGRRRRSSTPTGTARPTRLRRLPWCSNTMSASRNLTDCSICHR